MEPTRGLDPRIASSQQTYALAHIVEPFGERELLAGLGAASGEETAGEPTPRIPLPDELSDVAHGRGIAVSVLYMSAPQHRTFHNPHVSCIVWDCGHGFMGSLSYGEAPVSARGPKGTPVAVPGEG